MIDRTDDMRCSRTFSSCEEALEALRSGEVPTVVLIDVGLPGMNGIRGIEEIKRLAPEVLSIVLTVFDDQEKVFRAICAGASGYLLKASPIDAIAGGVRDLKLDRQSGDKKDYGLTKREHEILQLMVDGLIKKEIADRLSVSFHTVDTHLRNIYTKLQVNTQTGAVVKAMREGLVQ